MRAVILQNLSGFADQVARELHVLCEKVSKSDFSRRGRRVFELLKAVCLPMMGLVFPILRVREPGVGDLVSGLARVREKTVVMIPQGKA